MTRHLFSLLRVSISICGCGRYRSAPSFPIRSRHVSVSRRRAGVLGVWAPETDWITDPTLTDYVTLSQCLTPLWLNDIISKMEVVKENNSL